ncbi:hypothetical protein EHP00_497 [Ecytonucleospora hepatopenaei]|uniref:Uncharacterized protein n=1 Tax=Ecytonucleospora hepatopenaei TaxID=646526 RepID=A0A1W0E481_9MICR|nr:hypothetical protein EHP00_497 [Ecytonucleospora hepatopenaei]
MGEVDIVYFNKLRFKHLTTQLNYKKYKKYLLKNKPANFKLEANMCKYFITGSKRFLKKNIKILKNCENSVYFSYVNAFLKDDEESIVKAWNFLNENEFLYFYNIEMISLNSERFEIERFVYQWNDIELVFDSKKHFEYLKNHNKIEDFRFGTQLALKCFKFEEMLKTCENAIKTNSCVGISMSQFKEFLDDFKLFKEDNFVFSEWLDSFYEDFVTIYNNFVNNKKIKVSKNCFGGLQKEIDLIDRNTMGDGEIQKIILDHFSKMTEVENKCRTLPFLPIFYDLANDFVDYPGVDELAQNLASINLNK